ncbi:hypothetical protein C8R44DRAFT_768306 [Mycena epipterygia]|nr:hypothetical protein C8R44DRAFT_768306 [Mycena epipterygia]
MSMPLPARTRIVRFSEATDGVSRNPQTPAPTAMHRPLMPNSSPETSVPPPLRHSRPLYACMALPPVHGELHPILRINLESVDHLDVLRDPSYQLPAHLDPGALGEPATCPGLARMTLICPRLPWRIEIQSATSAFVSAADVRWAIHSALTASVTWTELAATPALDKPIISMAFEERCQRMRRDFGSGAAEVEAQVGIKRVDFLFGSHIFVGLSTTPEPDVWEMIFSS